MFLAPQSRSDDDAAHDGYPPERPDLRETIWAGYPPLRSLKRRPLAALYRVVDTGLFGLTPLKTHILICGYGRAGSTVLLAMMEYAHPKARTFGREIRGWRAATYRWRNHDVVISKQPDDIFTLHRLRNFYKGRKAQLKVILTLRDPRDVMTSKHVATGPDVYYQDLRRWRLLHEYYRLYKDDPDVMSVKYEDFVTRPNEVQQQIDAFTGVPSERPFADFHKADRKDFETEPMNGVRPLDRQTVQRWANPKHHARIAQILREIPDLPEILIEIGYEKDDAWLAPWRAELAGSPAAPPQESGAH